MAVWPFIISKYKKDDLGEIVVNHERIHFRQQLELLFVFFFLWYTIEYLVRWIKLGNRFEAYRAISFEKEAYKFESDFQYLERRSWFAWLKFL